MPQAFKGVMALGCILMQSTPQIDFKASYSAKEIEHRVILQLIRDRDVPTSFDHQKWMWFVNKRHFTFSCTVDLPSDYHVQMAGNYWATGRQILNAADDWYCSIGIEQKPSLLIEVQ